MQSIARSNELPYFEHSFSTDIPTQDDYVTEEVLVKPATTFIMAAFAILPVQNPPQWPPLPPTGRIEGTVLRNTET